MVLQIANVQHSQWMSCGMGRDWWYLRVSPQHTINGTVFSMDDRHWTHFFISCPHPGIKQVEYKISFIIYLLHSKEHTEESVSFKGGSNSWIGKILLVWGDFISWVTGLMNYNARQFITLISNVRGDINLWVRVAYKIHEHWSPRTMMIPQYLLAYTNAGFTLFSFISSSTTTFI